MTTTQDMVKTDLTNLLGNETQINPWPASYDNFIQKALERIARYTDFDFGKTTATISLTAGAGVLPTNARQSPEMDVRVVNAGTLNDYIFSPLPYDQRDNYGVGDYRYWITTDQQGIQTISTTETGTSAISVYYSLAAPTLNASIGTNFPSSMTIAKGALIYIREAEDKDADTGPEDAKFRIELEETIAAMQRNQPIQHARYISDLNGRQTGELSSTDYDYAFRNLKTPS